MKYFLGGVSVLSYAEILQRFFGSSAATALIKIEGEGKEQTRSIQLSPELIAQISDHQVRAILQILFRNVEKLGDLASALERLLPQKTVGAAMGGRADPFAGLVALAKKINRKFDLQAIEELETRTYARILFDWMEKEKTTFDIPAITYEHVRNILFSLSDRGPLFKWRQPLQAILEKIKGGEGWDRVSGDFKELTAALERVYDLDTIDALGSEPVAAQAIAPVAAVPVASGAKTTRAVDAIIALVEAKEGGFTKENWDALEGAEISAACTEVGLQATSAFVKEIAAAVGGIKQRAKQYLVMKGRDIDAVKVELRSIFPDPQAPTPAAAPVAAPVAIGPKKLGEFLKYKPLSNTPTTAKFRELVGKLVAYYTGTEAETPRIEFIPTHPGIKKFGSVIPKDTLTFIVQYQVLLACMEQVAASNMTVVTEVLGEGLGTVKMRYLRRPKCRVAQAYINFLKNETVQAELVALRKLGLATKKYALGNIEWPLQYVSVVENVHALFREQCAHIKQSIINELLILLEAIFNQRVEDIVPKEGGFPTADFRIEDISFALREELQAIRAVLGSNSKDGLSQLTKRVDVLTAEGEGGPATQALAQHIGALLEQIGLLDKMHGLYMVADSEVFARVNPRKKPQSNALALAVDTEVEKAPTREVLAKYAPKVKRGMPSSGGSPASATPAQAAHEAVQVAATGAPDAPVAMVVVPPPVDVVAQIKALVSPADSGAAELNAWNDPVNGLSILHALGRVKAYSLVKADVRMLWNSLLEKADSALLRKVDENGDSILLKLLRVSANLDLDGAREILIKIIEKEPGILLIANNKGLAALD